MGQIKVPNVSILKAGSPAKALGDVLSHVMRTAPFSNSSYKCTLKHRYRTPKASHLASLVEHRPASLSCCAVLTLGLIVDNAGTLFRVLWHLDPE
ncbi:hypothetical protein RRG08_037308 [Elysia crispata]|uniref:Uncharacterized protein n=1 Tax=Elysia crispata TaxID=231223 RepID=A0AAE1AGF1_9GAST|nr:hypothetical protein RRG08_037308 [Elysia crispata]